MSLSLLFSSCTQTKNRASEEDVTSPTDIQNRCIDHNFSQGQEINLYGIKCIEGKKLVIKTRDDGNRVKTSIAENNLKSEFEHVNEVYNLTYQILEGQEDDSNNAPYLRELFPTDKKFFGSKDTEYNIVFKIRGNFLILYKSSKDLKNIPYTERTSMEKTEDDKYMVPFLGYPIEYCNAEAVTNSNNEQTNQYKTTCSPYSNNAEYIKLTPTARVFEFQPKQDLLPADYFDGEWFVTYGKVESNDAENELSPTEAHLVRFTLSGDTLQGIDTSGDVEHPQIIIDLPVQKAHFVLNTNSTNFEKFGEKLDQSTTSENRNSLLLQLEKNIKLPLLAYLDIKPEVKTNNVQDMFIKENYFSFLISTIEESYQSQALKQPVKYRFSFRKKSDVNETSFVQKRWFREDNNNHFGVLKTLPQIAKQVGETHEDVKKYYRMIHFNTSHSTETIIEWYFSKNTPTGTEGESYRKIAREAVRIWNRAFEIITEGSNKSITIKLVEGEDKDLGDLRYNIINLVLAKNIQRDSLLGGAPSYVNPNTGQIIATTSNIMIHTIENLVITAIQHHIRNQVFQFQEGTKTTTVGAEINMADKDFEVISSYMKSQIKKNCGEDVSKFIAEKLEKRLSGTLKPHESLKDQDLAINCGKKIARTQILSVLLHEMGHSFGLGHNFKASIDTDNYYEEDSLHPEAKFEEFQAYLLEYKASEIYRNLDAKSMLIPYESGNFISQILKKYHKNDKKINDLESDNNKTWLELKMLESLKEHNSNLLTLLGKLHNITDPSNKS